MTTAIRHRYVSWREGRPRFQPSPELRALGYEGKDLRHADGRWFSRGEAVDWSDEFCGQLAWQKKSRRSRAAAKPAAYTVGQMVHDWYRSPRFVLPRDKGGYSRLSILDAKAKLRIVETDFPEIWGGAAAWLKQSDMRAMFEEIWIGGAGTKPVSPRGLASARGALLWLGSCYGWAMLAGRVRIDVNPANKLRMTKPPPRIRIGTRPEIEALVAAADLIGRPEWGDMILLGVWTGQRQGDRLGLVHRGLLKGRRHFRQSKTGVTVAILQAPLLEARLSAAMERRRTARAQALLAAPADQREAVERRFAHVVLDETRWLPFTGDHWSRCFAQLRAACVQGIVDEAGRHILAPVATLATLNDQDLRDTAVTWMALAGASIAEIVSVTGHSLESATQVLKHYLARHPEMADEAMRKLIDWYDGGGETEFGL